MSSSTHPPSVTERRRPRAIVVSGPAGSGKTTLAGPLAAALGYAIADLDTVTGPLTEVALALSGDAADGLDSPAGRRLRAARYATLLDVARANLDLGIGVVVAAPFTAERRDAAAWRAVTARLGAGGRPAETALIYLRLPDDLRHRRLAARGAPRDVAALRDVAKPRDGSPPRVAETLVPDAIVLDASDPVPAQLAAALDALSPAPAVLDTRSC